MKISKIFVTSDTHFGHKNIIRYTNRPFESASHMNSELIARWNSRVDEDDTVYFLGDFAMGPGVDENFTLAMLASLNGELKILLGNHDQPNRKHKQKGLKKIIQDNHLPIEILPDIFNFQHDGKKFVMSHYPMSDWDGKFHGAIHLHGHSHAMVLHDPPEVIDHTMTQYPNGVWTESTNPCIKNRYDIGVDMYGGPVELTGDCRYLNSPKGWH